MLAKIKAKLTVTTKRKEWKKEFTNKIKKNKKCVKHKLLGINNEMWYKDEKMS